MASQVAEAKTTDPLANTKDKVRVWAAWYRWRADLGYQPHSFEGRYLLRGCIPPRPEEAVHNMPHNEIADEVERHMVLMNNLLKHALVERHVRRRDNKAAAKKCHCSVSGFKERCMRAYYWLDGRLGG